LVRRGRFVDHANLAVQKITHRESHVQCARGAQGIQVPSPLPHPVAHLIDIHRLVLAAERDDRDLRVPEDVQVGREPDGDLRSKVPGGRDN
jgi:hypothetical protein